LVAAGAPLQRNSGETFLPVQPKPLKTWASVKVLLGATVGLLSVNPAALTEAATSVSVTAAIEEIIDMGRFLQVSLRFEAVAIMP
jgi:hypothetical protein